MNMESHPNQPYPRQDFLTQSSSQLPVFTPTPNSNIYPFSEMNMHVEPLPYPTDSHSSLFPIPNYPNNEGPFITPVSNPSTSSGIQRSDLTLIGQPSYISESGCLVTTGSPRNPDSIESDRNNSVYSIPEAGHVPAGSQLVSRTSLSGLGLASVDPDPKDITIQLQKDNKNKLYEHLKEKKRKREDKVHELTKIHDKIKSKISRYPEIFAKYRELIQVTEKHQEVVSEFEDHTSKTKKENFDFYENANSSG